MDQQSMSSLVMIVVLFAVMYFFMIRPQRKQQKERQTLLDSLAPGDKVITTGGIYGEIIEVRKKSIRVKVAKDVVLRMSKAGIQAKTSKSDDDSKED